MNKIRIDKMALILTTACNMRCKYCFESEDGYKPEFMSNEVIEESIRKFYSDEENVDLFKGKIELFGGEPLLMYEQVKHVIDTIKMYKPKNADTEIWITTNLFNLDKRTFKLLNESGIPTKITISVMFDKELHDAERVDCKGEGTYDKVYSNMLYAFENYKNLYYQCHQVITPKVLRSGKVKDIYERSMEIMNKYKVLVSTNPVSQGSTEDDMYTDEDIKSAIYEANEHILRHRGFMTNMLEGQAGEYIGHWVARVPLMAPSETIVFCTDLKRHITVGVDGYVHMCHRMYLGSEMESEPSGHITDSDIFTKQENKYRSLLEDAAQGAWEELPDGAHIIKRTSEVGYDCGECLGGHECHQCYVPMVGEHKNIKSTKDCENTRLKIKYKLSYHVGKIRDEHKYLNSRINKSLIELSEINPNLKELIDAVKEQVDLNTKLLDVVQTEYDK